MNNQTFYIVESKSAEKIRTELRSVVHRSGAWHQASNAFIVRPNNQGDFDVLVQKRSIYVDIAQNKIDQSVATQLLVSDNGDLTKAIERGLQDELGIHKKDILKIAQFNENNSIKISKHYDYNRDLWNRELITTYVVIISPDVEFNLCPKVESINWITWGEFKNLIVLNPKLATKTARLFVLDNVMNNDFENFVLNVLNNNDSRPSSQKYFYMSDIENDFTIYEENGLLSVIKYSTDPTIVEQWKEVTNMSLEKYWELIEFVEIEELTKENFRKVL